MPSLRRRALCAEEEAKAKAKSHRHESMNVGSARNLASRVPVVDKLVCSRQRVRALRRTGRRGQVSSHPGSRPWRHGRSVGRAARGVGRGRRGEDHHLCPRRARERAARALSSRGQGGGAAARSEHRAHLGLRRAGRHAVPGDGAARGGRSSRPAGSHAGLERERGDADPVGRRSGAGGRPRGGRGPPRRETQQRVPGARRRRG